MPLHACIAPSRVRHSCEPSDQGERYEKSKRWSASLTSSAVMECGQLKNSTSALSVAIQVAGEPQKDALQVRQSITWRICLCDLWAPLTNCRHLTTAAPSASNWPCRPHSSPACTFVGDPFQQGESKRCKTTLAQARHGFSDILFQKEVLPRAFGGDFPQLWCLSDVRCCVV